MPDQDGNAIAKVSYRHDAMIDLLVANPNIKQRELAAHFGMTQGWISQVMSSDAFKARVEARKAELVDPLIIRSVEEDLEGLARQSAAVLREKMDSGTFPIDAVVKVLDVSTRALGFGKPDVGKGVTINNYVALMPPKIRDSKTWEAEYGPSTPEAAPPLVRAG